MGRRESFEQGQLGSRPWVPGSVGNSLRLLVCPSRRQSAPELRLRTGLLRQTEGNEPLQSNATGLAAAPIFKRRLGERRDQILSASSITTAMPTASIATTTESYSSQY